MSLFERYGASSVHVSVTELIINRRRFFPVKRVKRKNNLNLGRSSETAKAHRG
eukprot:TRINITY_DN1210_c0_g1_i3.p4 TRINITY_DN1210_c0_g1~~TRINITY_DN1210_c0_g1_i3.p4  ORF type:complete len:53 (+),score=10.12 TRINITY_DN1210_c0_g1_i3:796-954(+)